MKYILRIFVATSLLCVFNSCSEDIDIVGNNLVTNIYYTTINGRVADLEYHNIRSSFISNTYIDGVGTVVLYGEQDIYPRFFYGCDNLKSVTIPEGVKIIGEYAFYDCNNLESVIMPEGVKSIEEYAFSGCDNLESVTIPESVKSIGKYAFSGCDNLESVTIPESVKSIEKYAFGYCDNLESVTIPESVKSIEEYAFGYCDNLKNVYLKALTPPAIDQRYTFQECDLLECIYVPESSVAEYKSSWYYFSDIIKGYDFD